MQKPSHLYDRLHAINEELWEMREGLSPELITVGNDALSHREWLEAEREELRERKEWMEENVTLDGDFVEDYE